MSTAEEDAGAGAGAAAQDGYLSPLQLARLSVKAQLYTRVKRQQNQIHYMVLREPFKKSVENSGPGHFPQFQK